MNKLFCCELSTQDGHVKWDVRVGVYEGAGVLALCCIAVFVGVLSALGLMLSFKPNRKRLETWDEDQIVSLFMRVAFCICSDPVMQLCMYARTRGQEACMWISMPCGMLSSHKQASA